MNSRLHAHAQTQLAEAVTEEDQQAAEKALATLRKTEWCVFAVFWGTDVDLVAFNRPSCHFPSHAPTSPQAGGVLRKGPGALPAPDGVVNAIRPQTRAGRSTYPAYATYPTLPYLPTTQANAPLEGTLHVLDGLDVLIHLGLLLVAVTQRAADHLPTYLSTYLPYLPHKITGPHLHRRHPLPPQDPGGAAQAVLLGHRRGRQDPPRYVVF